MAAESDLKAEELTAIIREIQLRVRSRFPSGEAGKSGAMLPDLMPLIHSRDAAEAKVASIGSVNPRPPGGLNFLIQTVKKQIARGLGWFVRDQVDFNRSMLECVESTLSALNESNRLLAALGAGEDAAQLKDMRANWGRWREEWERKLFNNEVQYLRNIADLQGAFRHRTETLDASFRETVKAQHAEFTASMEKALIEMQRRFWADFERVRADYERLIHNELRVIRQRTEAARPALASGSSVEPPAPASNGTDSLAFDYGRFADRFRGTDEYVRQNQLFYLPFFEGKTNVLDIGCGRGEFLAVMQEAGVPARGIDLDEESVALCRARSCKAETADLFRYLADLPDADLDGIFCAQVVEHLPPERIPGMIRLCAERLSRNGVLVIETPNPECLAIFATHFYIDPTHTRPLPPPLLTFYFEESGLGRIEVHRRFPAIESMPSLASVPEDFRSSFFGPLDYAIIGRKL
ncbi:MAG: class I SAM-dependent methyltransferase [Bryobacteraceae bacterium]